MVLLIPQVSLKPIRAQFYHGPAWCKFTSGFALNLKLTGNKFANQGVASLVAMRNSSEQEFTTANKLIILATTLLTDRLPLPRLLAPLQGLMKKRNRFYFLPFMYAKQKFQLAEPYFSIPRGLRTIPGEMAKLARNSSLSQRTNNAALFLSDFRKSINVLMHSSICLFQEVDAEWQSLLAEMWTTKWKF